jgi:heat-inducible transcriptional repressor
VEQYTTRATPVPSRDIINDYELGVSAATIRNEMAYLEHNGYITRPYPSAGSIPSDKGYRYYVETLHEVTLPLSEQRLISHLFHQIEGELEEWLHLAVTIMAQLTQNMAIVSTPKSVDCRFKQLELVALQDSLVLVVLVLHGARVKQQLITFSQVLTQSGLITIGNKLNAAYSGLTSSQILVKINGLSPIETKLTECILKIMEAEDKKECEETFLDGFHFMLSQPEFTHNQRMQSLMELVENRNLLRIIMPQGLSKYGVQVIIGKENKSAAIHNYSVIISRYGPAGEATGTVGMIGPTRMPYARVIPTVDYISSVLSGLVAELYEKETAPDQPDL